MVDPSDEQLSCALDLLRRMPPQKFEYVLQSVLNIAPQISESVLSFVDTPMLIKRDDKAGRDYLSSEFNRDGDSFRSPWSNTYDPPCDDGILPSDKIRALEIEANKAFDQYREMYFGGGISSVYCWDLEQGFAMAILIKKTGQSAVASGSWDSVHVVDVQERSAVKTAHYKLTSSVLAWVQTKDNKCGTSSIGGNISRVAEKEFGPGESNHVANIGSLVESMENQMRVTLNDVYFGSTKTIVDSMRSVMSADDEKKRRSFAQSITMELAQNTSI